jgi:putative ABC transport system permease protein
VLGANRKQLVVQFLSESTMLAAISVTIALALTELLLPAFNAFLDADISIAYLGSDGLLLPAVALVLIVGAAGGLYPAFYLSRFQPAQILKANKSSADSQGSGRLRNILVIAQFAVSIGLIICTAIVYAQTVHARTVDAGYRRDGLLQIAMIGNERIERSIESLRRELQAIPGVSAVGRSTIGVATGNNSVTNMRLPGQTDSMDVGVYGIDPGFIPAMGMRLLAGRNFDERQARDDATTPTPVDIAAERALVARGMNVVLTESAARRLGFTAREAVGKEIQAGLTVDEAGGYVPATVVGVVNDVRFRSARDPLQPILFYSTRDGYNFLLVRFAGADPAALRGQVERVWRRILSDVPFEASFAEERVQELYDADEARAQIFAMFALLSIVIGCLGLFGLADFTAERRTKEIGIRKVLGARTRDIIRLLTWQFSKPVIVANLIAWPVAWWVMREWLNHFDVRIDLGPTPFLLAGLLALAIAIGTISGHALRVARANPIHALRYE